MKNAGMAGAVALVGIGLITIGLSNFANRAEAVPSAPTSLGPAEPVIVRFEQFHDSSGWWRLWSDGSLEVRFIGFDQRYDIVKCGTLIGTWGIPEYPCQAGPPVYADTGWLQVPPPPGGNGFACRGDINGDRNVDSADLGLLIAQWGQDISCDPQPSYPCFDLNGLNMNIAAR